MFDIHVHSSFSHDGKSNAGEYLAHLRANPSIEAIGLAEHVDFMPECGGYGTFDQNGYRAMAGKSEFRDAGLYFGAEIDYSATVEDEIREALRKTPYAFTIASVHVVYKTPFSTAENKSRFLDAAFFTELVAEYYRQVSSCLQLNGIDCVGHIGIYKRYMEKELLASMGLTDRIARMEEDLARRCAESGKIVEVNTSGCGSSAGAPFPDLDFLRMYHRFGGRKVALGSDAHRTEDVCRSFPETAAELRAIGFGILTAPWNAK